MAQPLTLQPGWLVVFLDADLMEAEQSWSGWAGVEQVLVYRAPGRRALRGCWFHFPCREVVSWVLSFGRLSKLCAAVAPTEELLWGRVHTGSIL